MNYRLVGLVVLIAAAIACNAPSRPPDETPVTLEPAVTAIAEATAAATTTPADQPTEQIVLPDIEGTVNAVASATVDPSTPATISGAISVASAGNPAMRVYALRTDGQRYVFVDVRENFGKYTLEVPAGEYYILADTSLDDGQFEGGYTEMSKCLRDATGCAGASQTLIAILAEPGQNIEDIDLLAWVEDGSIFPEVP